MKFQMLGDANHAGPVRLSDVYNSQVGDASTGIAASQKALYDAYNSLNSSITNLTVRTTVSNISSSYSITAAKRANVIVVWSGNGVYKSVNTQWNTLCTLPVGYRPMGLVYFPNYDSTVRLAISTDGSLQIHPKAVDTNYLVIFTVVYLAP